MSSQVKALIRTTLFCWHLNGSILLLTGNIKTHIVIKRSLTKTIACKKLFLWTHSFDPSDWHSVLCFFFFFFNTEENLCRLLRLVMRNPDVLLGCRWMSSAVHDTAAGFSAQTEKQRLGAKRPAPSPCHPSIHLSSLSLSFSPLTLTHRFTPSFVPLLLHPYLPPLSLCLLPLLSCRLLWEMRLLSPVTQVIRGHVGAGSRKSAPYPVGHWFSPFHAHTLFSNSQSAWRTIHVKCQITNYTRESSGFKGSNALLISVKPNTAVNE